MELNVSGDICSFAQEEPPALSDWQLQQMNETNKMVKMYSILHRNPNTALFQKPSSMYIF